MPRNTTVATQVGKRKLSRSLVPVHNLLLSHSRIVSFLAMMAEGRIDLFRPNVDDNELHHLTLCIGHTGKL